MIDAPLITVADELHEIQAANEVAAEIADPAKIIPEPVRELPKLDEYPMPDTTVDPKLFEKAGITDDELLPVSRSRAYEFVKEDFSVYSVAAGDIPLCMDADEIEGDAETTMFGIDRNERVESARFRDTIEDRLTHQPEREAAFLAYSGSLAIYQMKHDLSFNQ